MKISRKSLARFGLLVFVFSLLFSTQVLAAPPNPFDPNPGPELPELPGVPIDPVKPIDPIDPDGFPVDPLDPIEPLKPIAELPTTIDIKVDENTSYINVVVHDGNGLDSVTVSIEKTVPGLDAGYEQTFILAGESDWTIPSGQVWADFDGYGDGYYTITVTVTDSNDNVTQEKLENYVNDHADPAIPTFEIDAEGNMQITVTDNVGVDGVELIRELNGTAVPSEWICDEPKPTSWSLPNVIAIMSAWPEGTYKWTVIVTDVGGNQVVDDSLAVNGESLTEILIDRTDPVITLDKITTDALGENEIVDGSYTNVEKVFLHYTASDNLDENPDVYVVRNNNEMPAPAPGNPIEVSSLWEEMFFSLKVYDDVGNDASSNTISYTFDEVAPQIANFAVEAEHKVEVTVSDETKLGEVKLAVVDKSTGADVGPDAEVDFPIPVWAHSYDLFDYPDGTYDLILTVKDAAGNPTTQTIEYVKEPEDDTDPVITLDKITVDELGEKEIADGSYTSTEIVFLHYTVSDNIDPDPIVHIVRDGLEFLFDTPDSPVLRNIAGLSGAHSYALKAYDEAENDATSNLISFTLDRVDPTITNFVIEEGHKVEVTVSDETKLQVVELEVVNKATKANVGPEAVVDFPANEWTHSYDLSDIADATYQLTLTVKDAAGNTETQIIEYVKNTEVDVPPPPEDDTPPSIILNSPEDDLYVKEGDEIAFSWQGADNLTDQENLVYILALKNSDGNDAVKPHVTNDLSSNQVVLAQGEEDEPDDGAYTWSVTVKDEAGLETVSESRKLTIDRVAPEVKDFVLVACDEEGVILADTDGNPYQLENNGYVNSVFQYGLVTFALEDTDPNAYVRLIYNGEETEGNIQDSPIGPLDSNDIAGEAVTVALKAYDTAGNSTVSDSLAFTVDLIAPTVQTDYNAENSIFTITTNDETSGVETISYKLDDAADYTNVNADSLAIEIPEGKHTVTYYAADKAGNSAEVANVEVGEEVDANQVDPPADDPPAEDPPAEDPPAEDPPAEDPPAEDPPAEDPPAEDPPAEDPPAEDPPAEDPPAEDPPAEDPPADEPEPVLETLSFTSTQTSILLGETVTLVASANIEEAEVTWTKDGVPFDVSGSTYAFTPDTAGEYTINVIANYKGVIKSDSKIITVKPIIGGLSVTKNVETSVTAGTPVILTVSVSGQIGQDETDIADQLHNYGYPIQWEKSGGSLVEGIGSATFTASEDGNYSITATVDDKTYSFSVIVNSVGPAISAGNLIEGSVLSERPDISFSLSDANGIDPSSVVLSVDGEQISSTYFSVSAASASAASGQSTITTYSVSLSDDFTLESGIRALSITARDTDGKESTLTVNGLQVYNNVAVQGTPMSYPNPFKPAANQSTTIKYTLTKDADIMLRIYDVTGRQVYSRLCAEGVDEGAKAGINYVSYNGRDAFGNALGNGLYHYFIVHQGSVVGRGQLAVLD